MMQTLEKTLPFRECYSQRGTSLILSFAPHHCLLPVPSPVVRKEQWCIQETELWIRFIQILNGCWSTESHFLMQHCHLLDRVTIYYTTHLKKVRPGLIGYLIYTKKKQLSLWEKYLPPLRQENQSTPWFTEFPLNAWAWFTGGLASLRLKVIC